MDNTIRVFSNKAISHEDIEIIKYLRKKFPQLSRKEYAATVCEALEWFTPAGKPKVVPCLEMLVKLESEGVLQLPVVRQWKRKVAPVPQAVKAEVSMQEITGKAGDYEPVTLTIARPNSRYDL